MRRFTSTTKRKVLTCISLALLVCLGYLAVTLAQALTNPSYGVTTQARLAEWGRNHELGGVVTWMESEWYRLNPPRTGGAPPKGVFGSPTTTSIPPSPSHLPAPVAVYVAHPLPGEGQWHPVGRRSPQGYPAIYESFVRPDTTHTSYVVGLAWMDPTLLKAQLYSGSDIPGGGPYARTAPITPSASTSLVAAFNAGFRMQDARGGYYTQGKTIIPLVPGAASVVIYKDGTMSVGQWDRDFRMSPDIVSVRQNLDLIVDNSRPVPGLSASDNIKWGATLGGGAYVWRSGIGVTANGAIVYAGGPSLSIVDLANVLTRAGCVRAMELDMNPDWVQYSVFVGPYGTRVSAANGRSLLHQMVGTPSRYFAAYWARDFFTMSLRATPLTKK